MNREELQTLLKKHNIPLSEWGTGRANTFEHLLKELAEGESVLTEENGGLFRRSEGSAIDIYYSQGCALLKLKEEKQVFNDGRERVRDISTSLGEKMKSGEDPEASAYRALAEELEIHEYLPLLAKPLIVKGPLPSFSYPGLQTVYTIHVYEVFLPPHLFRPEGYVEVQAEKKSYFVWQQVNQTP